MKNLTQYAGARLIINNCFNANLDNTAHKYYLADDTLIKKGSISCRLHNSYHYQPVVVQCWTSAMDHLASHLSLLGTLIHFRILPSSSCWTPQPNHHSTLPVRILHYLYGVVSLISNLSTP